MEKNFIEKSHHRSKAFGVNDDRIQSSKILNVEALEKKLQNNKNLIALAEPVINRLYNFVKGSGFFGILTDASGCILNIMGDENVLEIAFSLEMVPGAYMSEKHIGTNAMGTALWEEMPVQISGEEHFVKVYHRWTCSAAPIKDPKGQIVGTLNLTGFSDLVHPHTLGMVVSAVHSIELALNYQQAQDKLLWAKQQSSTIIDSIPKGIITISPKGYIKSLNRKGERIVGTKQEQLIGTPAKDFFQSWNKIEELFSHEKLKQKFKTTIHHDGRNLEVIVEVYPIYDNQEKTNGMIFIITDIPEIQKHNTTRKNKMYTFDRVIGRNKKFLNTLEYAKQIANSPSTVLITGESGTGKEVFAQSIHCASDRHDQPFVALNCGAIPKDLIESELFGYEEGAFTGAKRGGNIGKFQLANNGTLFLDEIGEMPLFMQTNLLRVLEDREFYKIGGNKKIPVNIRIIAATNKDLKEEVEKGNFRKDLYYRLNVLPLYLAPLRERRDDIPLFLDYFMTTKSLQLGKEPIALSKIKMDELVHYHWPGNIRELENVIEQMVNYQQSISLEDESLPSPPPLSNNISKGVKKRFNQHDSLKSLEDMEKELIEQTLDYCDHNITFAAKSLQVGRNTLYRKIKKYGISL